MTTAKINIALTGSDYAVSMALAYIAGNPELNATVSITDASPDFLLNLGEIDRPMSPEDKTAVNSMYGALRAPSEMPATVSEYQGAAPITAFPLPEMTHPVQTLTPPMTQGEAPVADKDNRGVPHDPRIHAANKATNNDGSWRKKRGVDDAIVQAIEAELMTGSQAGAMPMGQAIPIQPQAIPTVPVPPSMPVQAPTMTMPPMPAPQPELTPAPVAASTATLDFAGFMAHIAPKLGSTITVDYLTGVVQRINEAFAPHGKRINAITDVGTDQAIMDYAVQIFQVDGRW